MLWPQQTLWSKRKKVLRLKNSKKLKSWIKTKERVYQTAPGFSFPNGWNQSSAWSCLDFLTPVRYKRCDKYVSVFSDKKEQKGTHQRKEAQRTHRTSREKKIIDTQINKPALNKVIAWIGDLGVKIPKYAWHSILTCFHLFIYLFTYLQCYFGSSNHLAMTRYKIRQKKMFVCMYIPLNFILSVEKGNKTRITIKISNLQIALYCITRMAQH